VTGYLRDACPVFIAECQNDPELIKGFLKQNSDLIDENRQLKKELRELQRLRQRLRDILDDDDDS
jgi:cell shape-determining protein MreC